LVRIAAESSAIAPDKRS